MTCNILGPIFAVFGRELCKGFDPQKRYLCKTFGELCKGLGPNYVRLWPNYVGVLVSYVSGWINRHDAHC